jgi:hypothetical protein
MRLARIVVAAGCSLAMLLLVPAHAAADPPTTVSLDFDQLPGGEWGHETCTESATGVAGGVLTIDAPSCVDEFLDRHGSGSAWHDQVDNRRGWTVEARLRIAPTVIWINDHTEVVNIGFGPGAVCLSYPDFVQVPMDTTDAFHVYRITGKGDRIRLFVDGRKVIDHRLTVVGAGSDVLMFGHGDPSTPAVSSWDYFRYSVR